MLEQIESTLKNIKNEYENDINPIFINKEAISGNSICDNMLMALSRIKQIQASDEEKVRLFKEYIDEEKETAKELEMYEPLMSASTYDMGNLEIIEKKLFGNGVKKVLISSHQI